MKQTKEKPKKPAWKEFSEHEDGFKEENEIVCKVNEYGVSKDKINTEALYNDNQAFWQYHEKKIVAVLLVCSFYFLAVLL